MTWNYRVMRKANTETEYVMLGIHEVYYDENAEKYAGSYGKACSGL